MISRLTAFATCFAILSAATITFAAGGSAHRSSATTATPSATVAGAASQPVLQFHAVEVIGRHDRSAGN